MLMYRVCWTFDLAFDARIVHMQKQMERGEDAKRVRKHSCAQKHSYYA